MFIRAYAAQTRRMRYTTTPYFLTVITESGQILAHAAHPVHSAILLIIAG